MARQIKLKKLFSPIAIGGVELKNRIIMAPMVTLFGAIDGIMTEKEKNYFVKRAKGGVALITVGDCSITPNCQF